MENSCPFCDPKVSDILLRNDLFYARADRFPVSPGHLLIIPFRHTADFFDLTPGERSSALELVWESQKYLTNDAKPTPDGFNVGVNVGASAGQTVMHLHIHLIPRFSGDMSNPAGGVRGVIPEKRIYQD
jgi:diadenosine tetraphosphate (Ap4A) HIT family hydrolase